MRTTISLDDSLYEKALELADPGMSKADLIREAVKMFVRVQATKRLAALGGTMRCPTLRICRAVEESQPIKNFSIN